MVLDMGLRQPSPGHHNAFFYPSKQSSGQNDVKRNLPNQRFLRHSKWFDSESSHGNDVPRSEVIPVEMLKAQDDLTSELDGYSTAAFTRGPSYSSYSPELCGKSGSADCPSTNNESVNESLTGLCTFGWTLRPQHTPPIEALTRGREQKGKNTVSIGTTTNKRGRAIHDVDGPRTSHLSSKKRRLRLQLITSRLSQPFSLPATHILNRDTDEDTPVISRFVKLAALGAKKAGHQTTLVRKAAILNRVRLNVRQTAVTRGHDRIWRMTRLAAMSHGLQLVTDSTGAMFPGRSGEQVPGPIVPRAWRPHTTASHPTMPSMPMSDKQPKEAGDFEQLQSEPLSSSSSSSHPRTTPPPTSIMTPLAGADEDEASFPDADLDSRYADTSDDEVDGVYADFGVLFGGRADSPDGAEEDEHYYEEYLDEVDGIIWSS
ncbi:hypothetical protein PFICI_12699 [Pestalotiopsis fici W106-1]|uniref:Uncharacterized protein n=1 Tax=Pestalotiopsis fici (strain W106-1 / CGMCC3.15140) TaxID=1229662 RepID=W3WPE4_PESFW|nr:uncharacterized protein PFICI_12699 [Pestalotiopsis fici W106-1]ETS75755.1 hypothetical protein PFICI_12699 [Pestalotiopsis fici W106-1]